MVMKCCDTHGVLCRQGFLLQRRVLFFTFALLAAIVMIIALVPTKAHAADSYDPYTDGIIVMDVNGNVLASGSTIDINLIQQGILIKWPYPKGMSPHLSFGSPDFEPYSIARIEHGENYVLYYTGFKTLSANKDYTIMLWTEQFPLPESSPSYAGEGLTYFTTETTFSFTTGGQRESTIDTGQDPGNDKEDGTGGDPGSENTSGTGQERNDTGGTDQAADTGSKTPQTGSTSNSTNNSHTGSAMAPNASPTDSSYTSPDTMTTTNNGNLDDSTSNASDTSTGSGSDLATTAAGRSAGKTTIAGETFASMGTIQKLAEKTITGQETTEEAEGSNPAVILNIFGLPYLYALFMGLLIAALPFGNAARLLVGRYRLNTRSRIT